MGAILNLLALSVVVGGLYALWGGMLEIIKAVVENVNGKATSDEMAKSREKTAVVLSLLFFVIEGIAVWYVATHGMFT